MNDWSNTFQAALRLLLQGENPYNYTAEIAYLNPPWLLPIIMPLVWVPWWLMICVPAIILVVAAFRRRKPYLIAVVGLGFPFLAMSLYGNVDWVVWVGILVAGKWGMLLVSTKPQAGLFYFVGEMKSKTWRERFVYFVPAGVAAVIGTIIFPNWIEAFFAADSIGPERNATLFPFTIPFGVYALWRAWRDEDVLWGVFATLMIAPYYYIHSVVPFHFLLADRNWRWGVGFSAATWGLVALVLLDIVPIVF